MIPALAALCLAFSAPSHGAETSTLRRGDLDIRVPLKGTVVAADIFRSSTAVDACTREVKASTGAWRWDKEVLATLVSKNLSTVLEAGEDAGGEDAGRFVQKTYVPTPVYCREDCFLLRLFIKPKECVKAHAPIFEAARTLKLTGHVRAEDVTWVRDGAEFSFWPAANPKDRRRGKISSLATEEAGASFTLTMSPSFYIPPGDWEGELVVPAVKTNALHVPTSALIRYDGRTFLPVRVSTEMSRDSETWLDSDLAAGTEILIASAPRTATLRRGDIDIRAQVSGTVVPDDVFRLKSPIEGRIDVVGFSTGAWQKAGSPLVRLIPKELAAMLDAKGAQDPGVLEERWRAAYRPVPVGCRAECFLLRGYAKAGAWANAQSLLFDAASALKLVARVRPEDSRWVKDGQAFDFWPLKDPKRRLSGRVSGFILDVQGERVSPGASFVLTLSPERYFLPGTLWEGEIPITLIKNVLLTPTDSLIFNDGSAYLPVRVSTGITTRSITEIFTPVSYGTRILTLDDEQLHGIERHRQELDLPAIEKRLHPSKKEVPAPKTAEPPRPVPKTQAQKTVPEPDFEPEPPPRKADKTEFNYGDDPYGDP